jgi:3',5'-cyclic AMP phosphodiesterase CpdA
MSLLHRVTPRARAVLGVVAGMAASACASIGTVDAVPAILPPARPLPTEAATAGITKFAFIAYGGHRGRRDGVALQAEHGAVVESMLETISGAAAGIDPIRFVISNGDAVNDGTIAAQLTRSYIPIVNRLTQQGGVPFLPVMGNHDVGFAIEATGARRRAGVRNFLAATAKLIPPDSSPRRLAGTASYAFGYGNTFFLALDSNFPDDEAQLAWVEQQLVQLDRTRFVHVVTYFHHPPFSSGPHGGPLLEPEAEAIRDIWMPLFRKYHVRLLLTGHDHLYEHWVERYADTSGTHRMDEVVSGGGGAPLYVYQGEPDLRSYELAGAAQKVRLEHVVAASRDPRRNPYHYVIVRVDGAQISLEVVGVDWGAGFSPYPTPTVILADPVPGP